MPQQKITFDKFIRWAGIVLIVLTVLYFTNYLKAVLIPFFIAWVLAYLLYPIVHFVQYKMHVHIRVLAIIITLILVIAVIGGIIYAIIPPMIEQFGKLGDILSKWLNSTTHTNNLTAVIKNWFVNNQSMLERIFKSKDFSDAVKVAMPKVFTVLGQTANIVFSIIAALFTLVYLFFILLDYEYLTDSWIKIFPKKNRPFWHELASDVATELNHYVRGQGIVALIMGIMFCIGFTIIGFPMAIGMGILVGLLDLIPYMHAFALIPTAFLAMLKAADTGQNFFLIFGEALMVFAVAQVISDMIVTPKVMGKAMGLNPAILLLSLSIWGELLGFIGLIIALPLTTILIAYWQRYVTKDCTNIDLSGNKPVPIMEEGATTNGKMASQSKETTSDQEEKKS
ncbi:MAG: AI-2E family transporter [Prevotella sp.]|jgi:predicted PurR-regulated permease PerM|nr:AI-2E family transporter [Prevotella sp.]MCH4183047.1 AI-2E family transporter [Prevotella sp.]MCH4212953.1 AI-2E family transporter [Prevotella sp.]MCH4242065.1 AI-2E family transporter [Prevotella sp.]